MRRLAIAALLVALFLSCAQASAAPYVSCPGGYIADDLGDCPTLAKHPVGGPHTGGGSRSGGGVLGDLLKRLGLGGLL